MRTKTLVLTALLGLAATPMFAQTNVYSVNAVGYVQKVFPASQFVMFSNPLNTTNNTVGALLPNVPTFSNIYKWTGSSFLIGTMTFGGWDHPEITLNPGEGAFFLANSTFTNTFVGEVLQGNLTNSFPSGYSIRSSQVPQSGDVVALGLDSAMGTFDNLYKWTGTQYQIFTKTFGGWDPSTPVVNVGEAVFLNVAGAGNWTRTFSVNN